MHVNLMKFNVSGPHLLINLIWDRVEQGTVFMGGSEKICQMTCTIFCWKRHVWGVSLTPHKLEAPHPLIEIVKLAQGIRLFGAPPPPPQEKKKNLKKIDSPPPHPPPKTPPPPTKDPR